jgi:hypothetical protein
MSTSGVTDAELMRIKSALFWIDFLDKFTYFDEDLSCPALETRHLALQQCQ